MMKNTVAILLLGLIVHAQTTFGQNIKSIRANYEKATTDKTVCQSLIKDLSNEKISNLELAYLGALETIWAKYVGNPFSKLSTFNKGKEKLEKAVKNAPDNLEIRYLRLSVQKNAPSFLGYDKAIKTDKAFLKKNIGRVELAFLRNRIEQLLKG